LRKSGLGCHVGALFAGCILFADDLLLLSSSVVKLQLMLNICDEYGFEFDIKFNTSKSHLLQIGHKIITLPPLLLSDSQIHWVDDIKYLGLHILAGKQFQVDVNVCRRKFLSASFGVLQKCRNIAEEILCHVIIHSCLPILSYGVDIVKISKQQLHQLSVSFNTVVRRVFHLSRISSVRYILFVLGHLPFPMLCDQRRIALLSDCSRSDSDLLRLCSLLAVSSTSGFSTCMKYDVHLNMPKGAIVGAFKDFQLNSL
jgi:hypothetical protein